MSGTGQFSKKWEDLEFSDNYMFCKVLENLDLCQELLEILLHIKIDHLEKPVSEKTVQPEYNAKGIRMDVYVKNSNKVFDIEMQTGNYEDLLLRARYYQGAMDIGETPRRTRYRDLKETYIIFICKDDPFGLDSPTYTKKVIFEECPCFKYQDKSHFVVYNSSAYEREQDKEVRSVLKFIYNSKAETSFTNKLETTVQEMKQESGLKEGYMYFMDYVDEEKEEAEKKGRIEGKKEGIKEGIKEGKARGAQETAISNAKKMLEDNLPLDKIVQYSGLSKEKVQDLAKEVAVPVQK